MKNFSVLGVILILISIASCKENNENQKNIQNNLLNATVWYQRSAEMEACYLQAYSLAKSALFSNLQMSDNDMPKAVVLDIDETVLDNSPFEAYLIKNNLDYTKDLWSEWVALEKAKVLPGVHEFLNFARDNGVEVFYISNRNVKNFQHTLNNLQKEGLPFSDSAHILLKDTTSDKTYRRNEVLKKYDVILYVGDNLRDFDEIFANREDNDGKTTVENNKNLFGRRYIILPNPMYGEWTRKYSSDGNNSSTRNMIEALEAY